MQRAKLYPSYWEFYHYDEGDTIIYLARKQNGSVIYRNKIYFDTPEEAQEYFETECGA